MNLNGFQKLNNDSFTFYTHHDCLVWISIDIKLWEHRRMTDWEPFVWVKWVLFWYKMRVNVRRISRENNSSRARKGLFTTVEIQLFIVIMSLRGPYNSRKYQYCPILQAFYAHNPDKPTWMSLTVSLTWNSQPNWPVCQSKDATWPPFPPINNFLWVKVRLNMFIN